MFPFTVGALPITADHSSLMAKLIVSVPSHGLTMRHRKSVSKQIHKLIGYNFLEYNFILACYRVIVWCQFCGNP